MKLNPAAFHVVLLVVSWLGLFIASPSSIAETAKPERLIVPMYGFEDKNQDAYYFSRLLALALDKTSSEYGDYTLAQPAFVVREDRLKALVVKGTVDLMWHTSVGESERGLAVVPVPLLGELGHYRAFLIRAGDQERFDGIDSLAALQGLVAGIGSQWPGVPVLELNGLPFVSSAQYLLLFKMLAAGRFDYFPRGLYQIYTDQKLYPELDLVIESNLLLHYPNDVYFFVNERNRALAERLELGLNRAFADGSVAALVASIPRLNWAQQELARNQRRVIDLQVPE